MFINCHTGFSFRYGTLGPRQLFDEARRCGVKKLIVTEIQNTCSYMELLRLCSENYPVQDGRTAFGAPAYKLDIGVGVEFRNGHELLYILIAKNNAGFEAINRFLSHHNREAKEFPARAPEFENVFVIYPFLKFEVGQLRANEFIGIRKHHLRHYEVSEERKTFSDKYVILHPVTFLPPQSTEGKSKHRDFNIHRLLRAISKNTLLSKLAPEEQALEEEYMVDEPTVDKIYGRCPELINNTQLLLDQCSIECKLHEDKNKKFFTSSKEGDLSLLRAETLKGYQSIYGDDQSVWNERIEKELAIIEKKEFTAYYLITHDLIAFARKNHYDFVGRGSGANSTVAYCLGITNVDPIELDLYFERFLNEERSSPPDFDIDFSWDNRDAIYDYLFQTYGHEHVCLLGTHVTYQWNSILRELGKVFGLPKNEIDELVENPHALQSRDHIMSLVFRYAKYIVDRELPSHLSIHAGGVLITEKPVYAYTATDLPEKGYHVSHFEMHNAEDFGIYKFDILSQRGLGHIKETIRHIKKTTGQDVDINRFTDFKSDPKIKALLRGGRTMGCFYVESPAMRMLLGKLQCEDYLTLVAASSIIRPGVSSSGMMKTYIERFHIRRAGGHYDPIHPKMQELMGETYGVMVYQEDVIKVAHHFAGLTLTEADVLRRGMSGKYRSREEFERVKARFFESCDAKGYERRIVDRVWFEIESFSGYSFAKGHSASYAVESYQSLYLKAHYPLAFMVGVINNFGGFYKTEFYFHEARMNGGEIEAPCVNQSEFLTSIRGKKIFVGFVHLKGIENVLAKTISDERETHGAFTSLENFLERVDTSLEQVRILIRIGAFRFTRHAKQHLLWEAMLFFSNRKKRTSHRKLFVEESMTAYPLPALARNDIEDAFDEMELLGFTLSDPFVLLKDKDRTNTTTNELRNNLGKPISITGYVVTTKDARSRNGQTMHFGTFLDRNGDVFDTVHFPDVAAKFPFRGRGFYQIWGKVVEDFGVLIIEATRMEKLPFISKGASPATSSNRNEAAIG